MRQPPTASKRKGSGLSVGGGPRDRNRRLAPAIATDLAALGQDDAMVGRGAMWSVITGARRRPRRTPFGHEREHSFALGEVLERVVGLAASAGEFADECWAASRASRARDTCGNTSAGPPQDAHELAAPHAAQRLVPADRALLSLVNSKTRCATLRRRKIRIGLTLILVRPGRS